MVCGAGWCGAFQKPRFTMGESFEHVRWHESWGHWMLRWMGSCIWYRLLLLSIEGHKKKLNPNLFDPFWTRQWSRLCLLVWFCVLHHLPFLGLWNVAANLVQFFEEVPTSTVWDFNMQHFHGTFRADFCWGDLSQCGELQRCTRLFLAKKRSHLLGSGLVYFLCYDFGVQ